MPLHEYLEQKRRDNIKQLNATGACHICGSTCRNSQGFNHFMDNVEQQQQNNSGGNYNENSMVRPPNLATMRTCSCFGISSSDPDYWPYSLRVCDRCIQDDKGIGRIRNCGICGTVACDENCGAELIECTNCESWNNAGCIECRKMSDFSEMDIFRAKAPPENHGEPRMTRVCHKCLEQSTPWVKYDFVCRRFRCETRLVHSDIAERKRFCTFGGSPLNLLPEDGLVAIVDFLSGSDLKQLFLTCSAMCTVAERVAKEKVERVCDHLPTGPIVVAKRKDGLGQVKDWTHFEGKNDFGLRAPDDEKAWVGVYHYVEKITKEIFFFGFQMNGADGDKEIVGKFINQDGEDKFAFGQAYSKVESNLVPTPNVVGLSVRGGTVLVTAGGGGDIVVSPSPVVIASSQRMETGIHRVICRLFCPGSGGARGNNRDAQSFKLGSIGILRTNQVGDGPTNAWVHRQDVMEPWVKEETVFGVEYNADERSLTIHGCSNISRASRYNSNRYNVVEAPGDLYIAAELTPKACSVAQTLLTVRDCDADEWEKFVQHTTESNSPLRGHADMFDPMDAMEVLNNAQEEMGGPQPLRVRHQMFRQAVRNRRRERAALANEGDDGNADRGQARAVEGGRPIQLLRHFLPRRVAVAPQANNAAGQAQADNVAVAVGGGGGQGGPQVRVRVEGEEMPPRRVVRAVRPVARGGGQVVHHRALDAQRDMDIDYDSEETIPIGPLAGDDDE